MKNDLLKIMETNYINGGKKTFNQLWREVKQKEIFQKEFSQKALDSKYSKVYVIAKLGVKLDHYGNIKEENYERKRII